MPLAPAARFLSLPPHQTLTLGMDTPEMWLVESVQVRTASCELVRSPRLADQHILAATSSCLSW